MSASSILLINALLKIIPSRWIAKVPQLPEDRAMGSGNRLMSAYDKQANAKAFTKKTPGAANEDDDAKVSYDG